MCGIFVVLEKRPGQLSADAFQQGLRAIAHRGPDDERIVRLEQVSLGFRRLSIVDESGGAQPLTNEERNVWLLCNGEIYNHVQLRRDLEQRGHKFATGSDAEVILHLYEEDPQHFVTKLDGMFAFVLFDGRCKRLVWARDRLGIKPLVCFENANFLALASEAKAFFAAGLAVPSFDSRSIADFFTFNYVPGDRTLFENIIHVTPATLNRYEVANSGAVSRSTYWRPEFPPAENKIPSLGLYSQGLRSVFNASVRSHLMADKPVGTYLSGGIDSTVTSVTMQKLVAPQVTESFSIRFRDSAYDESPFFLKTIEQFGFKAHFYEAQEQTMSDFAKVLYFGEQPQGYLLDHPLMCLAGVVRASGMKVVLSGEGSDELFGGYIQFVLNQIRRALDLPAVAPFRDILLRKVLNYYCGVDQDAQALYYNAYTQGVDSVVGQFGTYPAWYPVWRMQRERSRGLLAETSYDPIGPEGAMCELSAPLRAEYAGIDDFNKSLYLEMRSRLPNYILHRSDRNSMANSVELRVPFLSNQMIDFSLTVPPLLKMFGVREKYILRKTFANILPKHILKRQKFGYSAPVSKFWDSSREQVEDLISAPKLKAAGHFNVEAVLRLKDDVLSPNRVVTRAGNDNLLLGVLSLQLLREAFL